MALSEAAPAPTDEDAERQESRYGHLHDDLTDPRHPAIEHYARADREGLLGDIPSSDQRRKEIEERTKTEGLPEQASGDPSHIDVIEQGDN